MKCNCADVKDQQLQLLECRLGADFVLCVKCQDAQLFRCKESPLARPEVEGARKYAHPVEVNW